MGNKWFCLWNVIVTNRILFLVSLPSWRDFAGDCFVLATGNLASYLLQRLLFLKCDHHLVKTCNDLPLPSPLFIESDIICTCPTALPLRPWMPWLLWAWKMSWRKRSRTSLTPMLPSFARLLVSCVRLTAWTQDLLFSVKVSGSKNKKQEWADLFFSFSIKKIHLHLHCPLPPLCLFSTSESPSNWRCPVCPPLHPE